jgi:CheY-like chemotaxis protein
VADKADNKSILLLDDELSSMTWMLDYLYSLDFDVDTASNANDAFELAGHEKYDAAIVDLNVPLTPPLDAIAETAGPVYLKFPGLLVAREARNKGHAGRRIIIYTVHREAEIKEIADKLGCTYIIKGRPIEIKDELERILLPPEARRASK